MSVSIPGVTLSSLIHRLKTIPGDNIGFLLGESYSHELANITDTESQGTRVKRKTCIQRHLIVEGRHSFADSRGQVDCSKLEELLGNETTPQSIVGWFVYRVNCSSQPSLLDRYIHTSLMVSLPHSPGRDLVFGLFTEVSSELLSIDYSFYQWIGSHLDNIHVDVINLQSTSVAPYQLLPTVPIPLSFTSNTHIMGKARELLFVDNELRQCVETEKLCHAVAQSLESLKDELISSYDTIRDLNEEIHSLQTDLDNRTLQDLNETRDTDTAPPHHSNEGTLPELIQLGDKIVSFEFPPSSPSLPSSGTHCPHNGVPQVDLLTGSPPPTGHTPLISDSDAPSISEDGMTKELET